MYTLAPGYLRRLTSNTEKLELPSISRVQNRGSADFPWYNNPPYQRPLLSSDRLPDLQLPQSYTPAASYSRTNNSYQPGTSTYAGSHSSIGLKTPSPSPTSLNIGQQSQGLLEEPAEHPEYPNQEQNIQPYTPASEQYNNTMNQHPQYMDSQQSHISTAQPYAPQPSTAGSMQPYSQYQHQPPVMHPTTTYAPSPSGYGQYGYGNGVTSPHGTQPVSSSMGPQMNSGMLPALPGNDHQVLLNKLFG